MTHFLEKDNIIAKWAQADLETLYSLLDSNTKL